MARSTAGRSGPKLRADHARRIFDRKIVPVLGPVVPQENPRLLILGGQPGSGKSVVSGALADRFAPGRSVTVLDFDMMREFFPDYPGIKARMGLAGDWFVGEDAYRWLTMAFDYVAARRGDVIVEHTLDRVAKVVAGFTDTAPYRVGVAVMATAAADSRLGMMARYQRSLNRLGYGRHPGDDLHDRRDAGLAAALDAFDADPAVDQIEVYGRGYPSPLYRNSRDATGGWIHRLSTGEVVTAYRDLPWDAGRSAAWLALHTELTGRAGTDWQRESLARARAEAAPLLDPHVVAEHDRATTLAAGWEAAAIAAPHPHQGATAPGIGDAEIVPEPPVSGVGLGTDGISL
ncbi:zeta toxin family protein [Nocardia asteroides]|uniref:zeta toxin family protein n=1 Tax=Nocardia asteroides TaxID=1824 RepID=UPI0037C7EE8C